MPHLTATPAAPARLQVEVDGVLLPEAHTVVVVRDRSSTARISCAGAFRPLVGKQFLAWRFISSPPATRVFAVKGWGGGGAGEGGGGVGAASPDPAPTPAHAAGRGGSAHTPRTGLSPKGWCHAPD